MQKVPDKLRFLVDRVEIIFTSAQLVNLEIKLTCQIVFKFRQRKVESSLLDYPTSNSLTQLWQPPEHPNHFQRQFQATDRTFS